MDDLNDRIVGIGAIKITFSLIDSITEIEHSVEIAKNRKIMPLKLVLHLKIIMTAIILFFTKMEHSNLFIRVYLWIASM